MNVADIEDVDGNIEIVFEDDDNKTPYPDDETNQPDSNLDTDEFSKKITKQGRLRRANANAGAGVTGLEVVFGTKKYASIQSKQLLCRNINANQHRFLLHKAMGIILTQMSANEGFRRFGQRAVAAMIKELKQLNDGAMDGKPAVFPIDPNSISSKEKNRALDAVNLIFEKRDGRIKGRICANGAKQRKYVQEGEIIASPTASLESITATLLIDDYEGIATEIADVPGAYLHALMPPEKTYTVKTEK